MINFSLFAPLLAVTQNLGLSQITALHRRWLTITGTQYDPAKHRGIAELYVDDPRFTAYYDKAVPGCARFLRDAVVYWAK